MKPTEKKIITLILILAVLFIYFNFVPVYAAETQIKTVMFGVISDTHVGETGRGASAYPLDERLQKVMNWFAVLQL